MSLSILKSEFNNLENRKKDIVKSYANEFRLIYKNVYIVFRDSGNGLVYQCGSFADHLKAEAEIRHARKSDDLHHKYFIRIVNNLTDDEIWRVIL